MGSIQVFPRKPSAARPARGWRDATASAGGIVRVREMRLEDYAAVRAVQRHAAPHAPAWTLKQFESRRNAFAEGQMVAVLEGQIVGMASSLVIRWDDYAVDHTWREITADGFLTTHEATGGTLYGAELLVDDARGGFGAARALLQARRRLCRRKNLARVITTARLAAYREERETMSPELYAMRVIWGDIADAWLRFQLSQGLQYCGIVHGFLPEDAASCGHAALLAWLNPLHSPLGPPAFIQSEGVRKCA